jgi:hypothetical protein
MVGLAASRGSSFADVEASALECALGSAAGEIRRVEFKSRLGHALAASGPIDLALILTMGTEHRRPILCNALGYSGQAVTLGVLPQTAPLERNLS